MDRLLIFLLGLSLFVNTGCKETPSSVSDPTVGYKFFVAGHAYGPAGREETGVWPPFLAHFDSINADTNIRFGVFAGDFVSKPEFEYFKAFEKDRQKLAMPTYVIPGNHELKWNVMQEPYDSLYASAPFQRWQTFSHDQDRFLLLDPNVCNWNICREQLELLKKTIADTTIRNLFIFTHQLVWWEPELKSPWNRPLPNSTFSRAEKPNFWSEVAPLLKAFGKPVFWFAGDINAECDGIANADLSWENVRMIGTGMGCLDESSYAIVMVSDTAKVRVDFEYFTN